ncbi:hypothetical protein [Nocardia arthritidis]|uniref:DUF4254 domain-containing protein n=1 Tax=Nocardia arthritidis TaxID=228602 RepID=A0A6G9Y6V8_9NOCA|nr:hypothetical protein [Nocardia arthritidis]QIS08817.1 hypothetical protein F5544_04515 [Nocardia arthritidis]
MIVTPFPSRDAILAACRGFPTDDHPMLDAAGELALLHHRREQTPLWAAEELDWHRARLMRDIDLWVVMAAPSPHQDARIHTHTMGQVIDQIAQLTNLTYIALAAAPGSLFEDYSVQLDEAGHAYQDLADELAHGTRRLPALFPLA